jgi:hypothetical protein
MGHGHAIPRDKVIDNIEKKNYFLNLTSAVNPPAEL